MIHPFYTPPESDDETERIDMRIKVKYARRGEHYQCSVFMGASDTTLACVGALTLTPEEFDVLEAVFDSARVPATAIDFVNTGRANV